MTVVRKLIVIITSAFCFICCNSNPEKSGGNKWEEYQVVPVDSITELESNDPILEKFKDTAQAQLNYLIKFISSKSKADSAYEYFIKSPYTDDGKTEHMWAQVFEHKSNYFIGILANEPQTVTNIVNGDSVKVYDLQIEDWILKDYLTNTEVGGFSQEYLRRMRQ